MIHLVLSIQSHVAYGHVGNAAAVFPLQCLGVEAVAIHTVQFSNHTGYGEFTGQVFGADHIRDVLKGLAARGVLPRCAAVLSGYLGDAAIGAAIVEAVGQVKRANPQAIYLCDPVMGDVGRGVFVHAAIPDFLRESALPAADLITPNQFEFELLCGRTLTSTDDAIAAARALIAQRGLSAVVITSLRTADIAEGLATLAVTATQAWRVLTPYLDLQPLPNGMGDVFSAVLLGARLRGAELPQALEHAVATLYGLVERTEPGARDLPLVAAQSEIVNPSRRFPIQTIG
ncbi:MAG: pyridoxal kinase [Nevskia sp.]|nr:pyridoxal kinase [Nevskia sp.]